MVSNVYVYTTGCESIDRNKQTNKQKRKKKRNGTEAQRQRKQKYFWEDTANKQKKKKTNAARMCVYTSKGMYALLQLNKSQCYCQACTREKREFMIADSFSLVGWFCIFVRLFVCLFHSLFIFWMVLHLCYIWIHLSNERRKKKPTTIRKEVETLRRIERKKQQNQPLRWKIIIIEWR